MRQVSLRYVSMAWTRRARAVRYGVVMSLETNYVNLPVSDGTSMRAYVARPSKPRAGLLVFQEAFGVNAHIRDVTERFAGEGYLAISPELFHRTAPGFEAGYTNFAEVMPHMGALTDAGLTADIQAAYGWLKDGGASDLPVGATGYCMGGRTSILAALTVPLQCAVSYYGGGIGPSERFPSLVDRLKELKAPTLLFWGGLDTHIGTDAVHAVETALTAAKKDYVNVVFSSADHGFFCDARASYNPVAARQAWALTLEFLKLHLASMADTVAM